MLGQGDGALPWGHRPRTEVPPGLAGTTRLRQDPQEGTCPWTVTSIDRPEREGEGWGRVPREASGASPPTDQARYSGGTHGDTGPAGERWGYGDLADRAQCAGGRGWDRGRMLERLASPRFTSTRNLGIDPHLEIGSSQMKSVKMGLYCSRAALTQRLCLYKREIRTERHREKPREDRGRGRGDAATGPGHLEPQELEEAGRMPPQPPPAPASGGSTALPHLDLRRLASRAGRG